MMAPTIFLFFSGNCDEAFGFYAKTLGGKISVKSHYRDMPPSPDHPTVPEAHHHLVMHITLELGDGSRIHGSDNAPGIDPPLEIGNNFSVSIQTDAKVDADRIHEALAAGGVVTMAMQDTFWGSYFGSCKDRFGVKWIVACNSDTSNS